MRVISPSTKEKINWDEKEQEFIDLCDKFRDSKKYDCLVPGSVEKIVFMQHIC